MVRNMPKCIICDQRPARKAGICAQCYGHIEAERKARLPVKARYYLTYRSYVVGLYPNGGDKLHGRLETRSADGLPKGKTINLDTYCDGYDRAQIKAFKRAVLSLSQM